jgi:hypothetical protein
MFNANFSNISAIYRGMKLKVTDNWQDSRGVKSQDTVSHLVMLLVSWLMWMKSLPLVSVTDVMPVAVTKYRDT